MFSQYVVLACIVTFFFHFHNQFNRVSHNISRVLQQLERSVEKKVIAAWFIRNLAINMRLVKSKQANKQAAEYFRAPVYIVRGVTRERNEQLVFPWNFQTHSRTRSPWNPRSSWFFCSDAPRRERARKTRSPRRGQASSGSINMSIAGIPEGFYLRFDARHARVIRGG